MRFFHILEQGMSVAPFDEIYEFARRQLTSARESARAIQFSESQSKQYAHGSHGDVLAHTPEYIGDDPRYVDMPLTGGVGGWAALLSVDLRRSSKRAMEVGAKRTFQTMHTYLPTMVELVGRAEGKIGGLRGDGLFGAFGFVEYPNGALNKAAITPEHSAEALRAATRCGKAMIECAEEILNPLLSDHGIPGDLEIGVGICVGDVVLTKIGVAGAIERTLYGTPVNNACKASNIGHNELTLTRVAKELYPTSQNGKMRWMLCNIAGALGGAKAIFPSDFIMLEGGNRKARRRAR